MCLTEHCGVQVHIAHIRQAGALREVVVKVRHPGVERRIAQDFRLLLPLAALTAKVRCVPTTHSCWVHLKQVGVAEP